jgi:hypothetical protein
MISLAAFLIALGSATSTTRAVAPLDTASLHATPSEVMPAAAETAAADSLVAHGAAPTSVLLAPPLLREHLADADTVRRRRRAVEMSDAAVLRLRIHRYAAYTVIPLFALQSIAGNQLLQADNGGEPRPGWAKSTHSFGAAALGTVFTVNTVTGLWALYDARANDEGKARRWAHTLLMLASDAGFTYTGIKLASDAKNSSSSRDQHRNLAYASMGTALVGYGIMFFGNR